MILPKIESLLNEIKPKMNRLAIELYERPELSGQEFFACERHCALLREYGFSVTVGLGGRPTGFYALYDSKKPGQKAAFLAEYDALPGIGHGCGHNILGAVSSGAGILLKSLVDEVGGQVAVIGTPAEETNGAKPDYIEQGVFDDVDFVMMAHPSDEWFLSGSSLALAPVQLEFFGKAAHASSAPEMGINALDAGIITMTAINALRGSIRKDSSVAGVVLNGGEAPNIVPDYCRLRFYVRSADYAYNTELTERVRNCARAGALATGARLEISAFEPEFMNLLTDENLSETYRRTAFEEFGLDIKKRRSGGSGDIGNVSHRRPTINPYFDISGGKPCVSHTKDKADCSVTPYAFEQAHKTAAVLAITGYRRMGGTGGERAV